MEKKGWKITAIIFICLFVASWVFMISMMSIGANIINNEIKCGNEICFGDEYDSYYYDDYTNTCQCYKGNEVLRQEIVD